MLWDSARLCSALPLTAQLMNAARASACSLSRFHVAWHLLQTVLWASKQCFGRDMGKLPTEMPFNRGSVLGQQAPGASRRGGEGTHFASGWRGRALAVQYTIRTSQPSTSPIAKQCGYRWARQTHGLPPSVAPIPNRAYLVASMQCIQAGRMHARLCGVVPYCTRPCPNDPCHAAVH